MSDVKIWQCRIGAPDIVVPREGDSPMRDGVEATFRKVVGHPAKFMFSGWGYELTEGELAVIENRLPDPAKVTREVPYFITDEMIERGRRAAPSGVTRDQVAAILCAALGTQKLADVT